RSGSSIIRWQSTGSVACLSSDWTTGRPRVRFGTKWLSMTSTCSQSAVAATAAASSARRAKAADNMLGEIGTAIVILSVECLAAATAWRGGNVVRQEYSSILSSTGSTWRLRMHSDPPSALLDRVRKLLAKAEAEGVTPPEAEALTAKAAERMARGGEEPARLAAPRPAARP